MPKNFYISLPKKIYTHIQNMASVSVKSQNIFLRRDQKLDNLLNEVSNLKNQMVEGLTRLCKIPAVSPHNGGTGEYLKALEIEKLANELGFDKIHWEYVDDDKSPTGSRPSLFLEYQGRKAQRICILSHIDVVPEGNLKFWTLEPFMPEVRGSRLYGRGVSDNGNCLIASLFALKAVKNLNIIPEYSILLAFVADEEMGSHYGLEKLLERNLFRPDDLLVVPDMGNDQGSLIEIAEKAIFRLKFTVTGKQVHASLPHTGLNACRVANLLAVEVDNALNENFKQHDDNFDPPFSTFEPTKRLANVPNTNTVPGLEYFEFDCRVLPSVDLDEVEKLVKKITADIENKTGAKINLEIDRTDSAPNTSPDEKVVKLLKSAVFLILNLKQEESAEELLQRFSDVKISLPQFGVRSAMELLICRTNTQK